jgi:predicted amidohydrolase YtcJ
MEYAQTVIDVIDPIRKELAVGVLVTMLDRTLPLDEPLSLLRTLRNDEQLAVIGCKAFLDGTFGSRTAAMLQEWSDDPGNTGVLVELAQRGELNEWIERVLDAGLSPSMHAIGDRAARLALDAADHADRYALEHEMTRQLVRIEHCQLVHPEDIPRFAGRVASVQPVHVRDDGRVAINRLGAQRMDEFFAIRALSESGAILAFGSDWPIAHPDPIEAIRAAMDGCDHDGRAVLPHGTIDAQAALGAYTTGARLALGMAPATLEPGGAADLVVLDRDPVTADWAHEPPKVLATISSGRLTYDAGTLETTS